MGFHDKKDCYFRGINFQPPELQCQLKIFNQVHGESPPSGHCIRTWNPPSVECIHQPASIVSKQNMAKKPPFANTSSKSNQKEIRLLESPLDAENVEPAMSIFLDEQDHYNDDEYLDYNKLGDITSPTICASQRAHIDNKRDIYNMLSTSLVSSGI